MTEDEMLAIDPISMTEKDIYSVLREAFDKGYARAFKYFIDIYRKMKDIIPPSKSFVDEFGSIDDSFFAFKLYINNPINIVCTKGYVELFKVLINPPFDFNPEDIKRSHYSEVYTAAINGHSDILELFLKPPFNMDRNELLFDNGILLQGIVSSRNTNIFTDLHNGRFGITKEDIKKYVPKLLTSAIISNNMNAIEILINEPYNCSEVINRHNILRSLILKTNVEMLKRLILPPINFSIDDVPVGESDTFISDLLWKVASAHQKAADVLKILMKPPFGYSPEYIIRIKDANQLNIKRCNDKELLDILDK